MPKPMYVWSGSAWVSVASEVESLATYATQSYADNQPGMKMIVPSSVAVGSGSGSVNSNGVVTFTSASSISVNGCFTSTYDNYRIVVKQSGQSGNELLLRVRASGTDNSSSNYIMGALEVGSQASIAFASTNNSTRSSHALTYIGGNIYSGFIDIYSPQLTENTTINSSFAGNAFKLSATTMNVTTSYDGFTIYASNSGAITGTIRVYGLKNG